MSLSFICCSIGLRHDTAGEAIAIIANAGFPGIEFWYSHLEGKSDSELSALAAQARERNLSVPVISPYLAFTRGPEWIHKSLETAEAVLKAAAIFGATKVRTFVDIGPDGLPSEKADDQAWKDAVGGLKQLCDLDPQKEFVVETHENTLADTLPTVQRLLEEVDRPNLKLNYQMTHDFMKRGYLECLEILWPHVSHMHWQQHKPDGGEGYMEEEGVLDFPMIISWLKTKNYRGTIAVEYCWNPVDRARIESAARFLAPLC